MIIALMRKSTSGWRRFPTNPTKRPFWQQMAQQWLGMIPKVESPKSDHFEARQRSMQTKTEK